MLSQTVRQITDETTTIPAARGASPGWPETASAPEVPAVDQPETAGLGSGPDQSRVLGLCGWAGLLGLFGLLVGLAGLVAMFTTAPAWYKPALIIIGLVGLGLTAGAFLRIRDRYTPWLLLSGASAALIASIAVTAVAA